MKISGPGTAKRRQALPAGIAAGPAGSRPVNGAAACGLSGQAARRLPGALAGQSEARRSQPKRPHRLGGATRSSEPPDGLPEFSSNRDI
jgi:hypothetical protein